MSGLSRFLLLSFVLLGCGYAVVAVRETAKERKETPAMPATVLNNTVKPPDRVDILDRLTLENRRYTGRSGDPLTASFSIKNANDFAIKDFTVRFTFYGNSGSMISSRNITFYEIVSAKGSKKLKDMRLGFMPDQGTSVSAEVIDYGIP